MTSQISGEKIYYLINGAGAARSSLGENKISTIEMTKSIPDELKISM